MVDAAEGILGLEWIEGRSVRWLLPGGAEDEEGSIINDALDEEDNEKDHLEVYNISTGEYSGDSKNIWFRY